MNMRWFWKDLTVFERVLWLVSVGAIASAGALAGGDPLSVLASLVGVTSLLFVAKGYVCGQILMVIFSVMYGVISLVFRYYGEMITYLGMTAPMAVVTAVSWYRHPYAGTREVAVSHLTRRQAVLLPILTVVVTLAGYALLAALGNAQMLFSTISVATSFIAAALTCCRSPYYALGYAANDVVLVVLWVLAAAADPAYWSMVICFALFLINDLYGFVNWRRMQRRQSCS